MSPNSENEETARLARIREIAQGSGARWKEPYRSEDHGDLLYKGWKLYKGWERADPPNEGDRDE